MKSNACKRYTCNKGFQYIKENDKEDCEKSIKDVSLLAALPNLSV